MSLRYTPYMLPFVLSSAILATLAIVAWRNRARPGAREFAAAMVALFIWTAGYALEIASVNVSDMIFWANVQFLGIASVAPLWLLMILRYTGRRRLPKWTLLALAIVPIVTIILAWSNPWHHLFRGHPQLDTSASIPVLAPDYGAWAYYVLYPYTYALFAVAILITLGALVTAKALFSWQFFYLVAAPAVPLIINVLYNVFDISPIPHYNLTTAAFSISGLLMALALFRYRLLDIVPVARDKLIESMEHGIVVLDPECRIADINPAALRLLGASGKQLLGQDVECLFAAFPALVEHCRHSRADRVEMVFEGASRQTIEITATGLRNSSGDFTGHLVVLRDISERRRAEVEREKLITELQQALAEVKKLSGLLPICASCKRVRDDQGYWQQIEAYISEHSQAQFSHGLCPDCLAKFYADYPEFNDGINDTQG